MIVIIGNNIEFMEKLSAHPILINPTDKLVLENGKRVLSQTARDTISTKCLINGYAEYEFHCHKVSNFVNVMSNDIKQNISSMYVDFYAK